MDQEVLEAPDAPEETVVDCGQYICFLDTGLTGIEEKDRVPVGIGATRAEAFEQGWKNAIPHVAEMGYHALAQSSFACVAQPNLSADEFAHVGKIVEEFFASRIKLQTSEPA
jgi:hypothetical protein